MVFNDCKPAEAIQLYVGDDYLQHHVHVASGTQGFIGYFERMAAEYPCKHVDVKRSFAVDNHVILYCHQVWPEGLQYASIDIFRLDDAGKIVEQWDVLQVIPDDSANDNSMF